MVSPGAGPGGKARGIYAGNGGKDKASGRGGPSAMRVSSRWGVFCRLRDARRPAHATALEPLVFALVLGRAAARAHRDPGLVDGLGVSRNERVPPIKIAPVGQKAVGAARRQPHDSIDVSGG